MQARRECKFREKKKESWKWCLWKLHDISDEFRRGKNSIQNFQGCWKFRAPTIKITFEIDIRFLLVSSGMLSEIEFSNEKQNFQFFWSNPNFDSDLMDCDFGAKSVKIDSWIISLDDVN